MSDLKIPTDQYYIRNGRTFAGRNFIEDKSDLPKKVACPTDDPRDPELFLIRRLQNGRYYIEARGAPTGVLNGLLFAILNTDIHKPEEWIITLREVDDGHRSLYTIERANRTGGWVKHEGENPQIGVRPLIVGPSDPPFFPPHQLWNIQPLVD